VRRRSTRRGAPRRTSAARFVLLCAGLVCAALPAAAEPASVGDEARLEALMRGMASTSGVVARFRERKQLALLSTALESSGRFVFVPPDRLSRVTEAPSPSHLVIDGDLVSFHDGAGGDSLDLTANPVAQQYVRNFTALFSGDLEGLRERYALRFEAGEGDTWGLELVPRSAAMRRVIERVRLDGSGRALERMELVEVGGDRTTTWFDEVRTDVELDAAALARFFPDSGAGAPGADGP